MSAGAVQGAAGVPAQPPEPAAGLAAAQAPAPPSGTIDGFASALEDAVARAQAAAQGGLRLSGHAAERLAQAGLRPGAQEWEDLGRAVGRAAAKGSRQTLVLWGGCALVVAVPDRTVVTAVAAQRMQDHVFTGIDSAVVVPRA